MKIPRKYIPKSLSKKDFAKAKRNIQKTRKLYKKGLYIERPKLKSYKKKKSKHVEKAKRMYNVDKVMPTTELSKKSKCSVRSLRAITKKGRGAFYSSGSRPMQTAQSWARARLASALTGGPASKIDYHLLQEGCKKNSPVLALAKKL
jgi:hypothetical protein